MKQQKLLIVNNPDEINRYLQDNWEVISITAQYIGTATISIIRGSFAVLIQKQNTTKMRIVDMQVLYSRLMEIRENMILQEMGMNNTIEDQAIERANEYMLDEYGVEELDD